MSGTDGVRCPRCQRPSAPGATTCAECGVTLQVGPSSYTPPHLSSTVLNVPTTIEGEHKQVTVLFCDIVGSTGLAERLGAEGMHAFLESFFALSMAEVHRYEGTINQFLGDGFMALFGAPLAHEDHARRAALAASAILRAMERHRVDLGGVTGTPIAVRMGLNSGAVVVGRLGDNLRMDYTAVGDTTNLAARLQQLAEPGAAYLTDTTRRLIDSHVETIAVGERRVKGKNSPIPVFRLVGPRRQAEPGHHPHRSMRSPLVGRDVELQTLVQSVARLHHGHGGVVSILGEAGLGKSRLIAEARVASGGDVTWLEGRGLSFGANFGFHPFLEILRAAAGIVEGDSDERAAAKLERLVVPLFPNGSDDILPYVSTLLSLPVAARLQHRVAYLDGHATGLQVFRSVRRLFEQLAGQRPLVVVFEDLHWADQSSLDLLEHILPLVASVPVLFILTARPEHDREAAQLRASLPARLGERCTEVVLAPLSEASSLALLDNLVPGRRSARFKGPAIRRAEGNPLFLEEIVRTVVAGGMLVWNAADGSRSVAPPGDYLRLPDTLQDVISARIDRLDADVKQLVKLASVIGRTFFHRILCATSDAGDRLDGFLQQLEELDLIREKRRVPEREYFFKHALVQETAYAMLLAGRRRELHRRIGECIESLFADRLEDFFGVLAYHYARAEVWQKAQEYLRKAGDQAARVAADAEALAHYQHAIAAYERTFGDRWDPLERATLERKVGEALFRLGQHERALEQVITGKRRLHPPLSDLPRSRWGIRLAIVAAVGRRVGRTALARVYTPRPLAADPRALDEIARMGEVTGWIDYFLNPERFLLQAIEGLSFFERRPHAIGLIYNHMSIGLICDVIPLFGLAERHHRQALAIATENGQPIALGHAHLGVGIHAHSRGTLPAALEAYEQSGAIFREIGHIRGWGGATMMQAWIHEDRGDFGRALALAEAVTTAGDESADPQVRAWGLQRRGASRRQIGRIEEALADLETAVALATAIPDYAGIVQSLALVGLCHLDRGDPETARRYVDDANRTCRERSLRGLWVAPAVVADAEVSIAELRAATANNERSVRRQAARASRAAERLGRAGPQHLPTALRLVGSLRWHEGRAAAAEKLWRRSAAAAEAGGARYHQALAAAELGHFLGQPGELERAAEIFRQTGALRDLQRVERRLRRRNA